jgi:hypothetical protein
MSQFNVAQRQREQKDEEKREKIDALVKKLSTGTDSIFFCLICSFI